MTPFRNRARHSLLGLAIGDAISWPAMFHRSWLLPAWTRRLRREIDTHRESASVIRVPMPFSLNQPPESFDLFPTDDTEWTAWAMQNLLHHSCIVDQDWVEREWSELARSEKPLRGAISTLTALANFRKGLKPPVTGSDNPHYFDDGSLCRAVPIGLAYAGNPDAAANAAAVDAHITNSEDGVWVASSVAAAISAACQGGSLDSTIDAALGALPMNSWSRRTVDRALEIAGQSASLLSLVPSLHHILHVEYSDGCAGPETLALSLAIVSKCGHNGEHAITAATCFAKGADALPAIVGALAGSLADESPWQETWTIVQTLRGVCLPSLGGTNYLQLIDDFVSTCSSAKTL